MLFWMVICVFGLATATVTAWAGLKRLPRYYSLEALIDRIDEPHRTVCRRILSDHERLFCVVQGSRHNHQAWPGGYIDHVREVMNFAVALFWLMSWIRPLPFSLSDALLVLFLHDLEKPWKYEIIEGGEVRYKEEMSTKGAARMFREEMLSRYGLVLTDAQRNGLTCVEGEFGDYSGSRRVMGPLAAFAHMCDVVSARIWYDHPFARNDSWRGAARIR